MSEEPKMPNWAQTLGLLMFFLVWAISIVIGTVWAVKHFL